MGITFFTLLLIDCIYKDHGMIHQPSTPYVKQQNGVVERRTPAFNDDIELGEDHEDEGLRSNVLPLTLVLLRASPITIT